MTQQGAVAPQSPIYPEEATLPKSPTVDVNARDPRGGVAEAAAAEGGSGRMGFGDGEVLFEENVAKASEGGGKKKKKKKPAAVLDADGAGTTAGT